MNDTNVQGTIETLYDIDSLLNTDLTELAALADIKVPPIGRYTLGITSSTKESDGKSAPQVVVKYEVIACLEQVNAEEVPAKIGDSFFTNFNINNRYGLGLLQNSLTTFSDHFGVTNIGELLGLMEGVQINGTVKQRKDMKTLDDDGNPRVYGTVVNVEIL